MKAIPITVDKYLDLPDEKKRAPGILWVIFPDDYFEVV